jgi:hypothetical protein
MFKASTGYAAKIVWMAKPNDEKGKPLLDTKNPNPSLRKNPLIGTVLLYNLQFDGRKKGLYQDTKMWYRCN